MAQGKFQGKQPPPILYIHALCTLKVLGDLLRSDQQENVTPHCLQTSNYFLNYSKQMFISSWESFCNHQERKNRQIKTEFMNPKQFLEGHVPLPQLFFFFFFTNGFLVRPFGIF